MRLENNDGTIEYTDKEGAILTDIVFIIFIVIIVFVVGILMGSWATQSSFRESLCRDMPTTEEYFECKSSNDFTDNYKLIKRTKNIDLIESKKRNR